MADKKNKKLSKPARNATQSAAGGKVEEIVDKVAALSVLELSELVSALQEKLGVTPQAVPATAGSATGQGAATATEAETPQSGAIQTVVLTETGANKIAVIKALREINRNLTLMDAKAMTETVPAEVLKEIKAEDAKAAADKLKAAGASIELK